MGLFGDLFGSSSHSQSTQSTSTVSNTQIAGGNVDAPVIYGNNNRQTTTVNAIDGGTVAAATDISRAALELGANESLNGTAVAIAGLNHASDAYTSSLALVGDVTRASLNNDYAISSGAVDSVSAFAGKALDSVSRFSTAALDSNTYIAGKSLDSTNQAYNSALGQVNALAQEVSQSSQQNTNQTVTRVVWAVAAAVALIVIYRK